MRPRLLLGFLAIVILAFGWIAFRRLFRKAFVAHGVLQTPALGELKFAGDIPNNPFKVEPGNALARTVFQTSGPSNSRIEIRELLVQSREETQLASQPGPMLIEVESGAGTVSVNGKREELAVNTIKTISAGQTTVFRNGGARPLALRIYRFEAK